MPVCSDLRYRLRSTRPVRWALLVGCPGLLCLLFAAPRMARADAKSVLPAASAVKGWKQVGATKTFNSGNLFDLIDGEAQAVLAYSFAGAAHAEYAPASATKPVLTIDVYDMSDPLNAFGLFGSDRLGGKPFALGAEGVRIDPGALNFWKGRYVVRTTLVQAGPANMSAQIAYAKAIAARIPGASARPTMVNLLPPGYAPHSEKYQRSDVAAQNYIRNAVVARYPSAGPQAELFIAVFPSPAAAKQAYTRYQTSITAPSSLALGSKPTTLKGVGDSAIGVKSRISGQIVAAVKSKYLISVRRAKDPASAQNLVKAAVARAH